VSVSKGHDVGCDAVFVWGAGLGSRQQQAAHHLNVAQLAGNVQRRQTGFLKAHKGMLTNPRI